MRIVNVAFPTALALVTVACAHDKPPQTPSDANGIAVTNAPQRKTDGQSAISMSEGLRHVCGIEDTGAAPKFDFDSAVLSSPDRSELDQLAKCMTTWQRS